MVLWTIQPEDVYNNILETGVYSCDLSLSCMKEHKNEYTWLTNQMEERIGPRLKGVDYPVWAQHTHEGRRKRPDLRRARWGYGWKGEKFYCLEIDVPDDKVLLSDFDSWSVILLGGLLSETEEEDEKLEREYASLPSDKKWEMMSENWEKVFDISPLDNGYVQRGDTIQATFWELRREYIQKAVPFISALAKPGYLEDDWAFKE